MGDVGKGDVNSPALARAVASAYYRQRDEDFLKLAGLFYNKNSLQSSVFTLAQAKFPYLIDQEDDII